jgi:hypothetical protein
VLARRSHRSRAGTLLLVALLTALVPALTAARRRGPAPWIQLATPAPYQVFQRDSAASGAIPIEGVCSGLATGVQARFRGSAWVVIDAAPDCTGAGTFQGVLTGRPTAQGSVDVRFTNRLSVTDSVTPVGIGDVFVIAGQSNAEMEGDNLQAFQHPTLLAGAYTRNDVFKLGDDPIHHSAASNGSSWPLLATLLMGNEGIPVGFVATAVGSTGLLTPPDWEPGNESGLGLYARLLEQVDEATHGMGTSAVLWFQGENEALFHVAYADYLAALFALADAVYADLGVPLVVGVVGKMPIDPAFSEPIRQAQRDAAALHPNILAGPETQDLPVDPFFAIHFVSDFALRSIAERWCASLSGTIYGPLDCQLSSFEAPE